MSKNANANEQTSSYQVPLIPNKPATDIRFEIPTPPNFPIGASLLSILSLIFMSVASVYIYKQLGGQLLWVKLPFLFTIFGGTLGWVFELGLLLTGTPFQMFRNRFTTSIQKIRFLNIAPVVGTIFFFVCAMTIPDSNLRIILLLLAVFGTFAIGIAVYLGPPAPAAIPLIILGVQVAQLLLALCYGSAVDNKIVTYFLLGQAVLQAIAFIVGTATPLKSTGFHVISTLSGLALYFAIAKATEVNPNFSQAVAPVIPTGSLRMWGLVAAAIGGLLFMLKASPMTYNILRTKMSNAVWGLQYFLLISAKRFPKPFNLGNVYKDGPPEESKLKPYYQQHPEFLPEALTIPAVERIEGNVTAFGEEIKKVKKVFKLIAGLDHAFPQADINTPLKDKPRMHIWSNGADVYPRIFLKTIFGQRIPIQPLKKTPEPAIETYKEGQLLAYLAESGVANTFLKKAEDEAHKGMLEIDFRFLEKYKTKADYEPYGGKAYFRVDSEEKRLKLVSVIAPLTDEEIPVNAMDSTFRRAESMIIASLYYQVISGKHLAEIHMTYNLLEVVLHNAFDAKGQYNHPFRTFMYLHLFSHELAEELTTEHLVQENAVFTQVFATTHSEMINHLNDTYSRFQYGEDEDFDYRKEIMEMENGELLPNACIKWELVYMKIFRKYTDKLINTIYKHDEDVQKDEYIQAMRRGLNEVMLKGMPERYDKFQTKSGLSRWAADTIQHLVIRHQVYGTSGVRAAMDPRISTTQVPRDGGTPGVDEWRSLICVGLATACARFTLLLGEDAKDKDGNLQDKDFLYLLEHVDEQYVPGMTTAFKTLHKELETLNREWTKDYQDEEFNYNYFRPIPADLRTGPGY